MAPVRRSSGSLRVMVRATPPSPDDKQKKNAATLRIAYLPLAPDGKYELNLAVEFDATVAELLRERAIATHATAAVQDC